YADKPLLKEPCVIDLPFGSKPEAERGLVDFRVTDPATVAGAGMFIVEFDCDTPEAIGHFSLYFHSGDGWYAFILSVPDTIPGLPGRYRMEVARTDVSTEGKPGPWEEIDLVRFAAWRGDPKDGTLLLRKVDAVVSPIVAVMSDLPDERQTGQQLVARWNRLGVPVGTIPMADLTESRLAEFRVVVLPLNSRLEERGTQLLTQFVEHGGKLVAFYQLPETLMRTLGFEPVRYFRSPEGDEAFAQVRFEKTNRPDNPFTKIDAFNQSSWNINTSKPLSDAPHNARIAAWWHDATGQRTEHPALLVSDRGAFFSHIITNDDPENQNRFLVSLLAQFDKSPLHKKAVATWHKLLSPGDSRSLTAAQRDALAQEYGTRLRDLGFDAGVEFFADDANDETKLSVPQYLELIETLDALHEEAVRNYCESLDSREPEFRAWWEHAGLGAYPGDWDRTMRELADSGFNAVIPNLLWGGSAHYASDVLPRSAKFGQYGDQVEQAIAAGEKYGVEVHAWQVCWWLNGSPREFIEQLRKEGRTQVGFDGAELDWLCPSHPANVDLECETFCELVRKYPKLAGIHFDYIRYPGGESCFCDGCRQRFCEATGCEIQKWPADVRPGNTHADAWTQWRCDTITTLVARVHREAKAIRPDIKISAAVFSNYPNCRKDVGQDWALWVERSYLDFVCPMDYTDNLANFERLVTRHHQIVGNRIPLYPGIGATATGIAMTPDRVAAEIEITRRVGTPGFVIFNLDARTISRIPPMLKLGPTKSRNP
ncbi:MAG: family 10 glycosylhydrolase, partial [Planctomycetaceae bacterium]|nr:family 10 glycosylhydrolase [Planctomycetaceae bacterium]